ncbi:hypothetical protein Goklo_013931 [Gossypium klotzschianum]|uniref:DUF7745 domain-containing protein n=1 Tax=Gossypium klotzschianum TaxID=34286 RepID=A0A7J8U689_9ROSI|nr:hypothetical protein [Gossypium klotzschianum]
MEKGFLDKVEDNASVRIWAETMQQEKGNSLINKYVSELWDFTRISVIQNNLQEMKEIWDQWDDEIKQLFYCNYDNWPYLLNIKMDKHLFRALDQFWNPAYSCFTFGKVDLVPTVKEYMTLLRCPKTQTDKAYSRAVSVSTFLKKLMSITGMSEQWKRVDVFGLGIYGLVVFPKALGHIDKAVSDLFDRLDKKNLQEEDVEWRAPWMIPNEIMYRCGDFEWVPLLRIWGAVGYASSFVLRKYRSRQFIPATRGLAQCEFSYKGDNYKKKVREISNAWNQTRRIKIFSMNLMTTLEYSWWLGKRVNDNISMPSQENTQSIEEHLQLIPSELEIIKQDFEKRSSELGKKIEQLEEENMHLGLDVDIHKLEAEKLRKGKNKAEEDLDSLKTDYKKLRFSIRTVGLAKTS